MDIDLSQVPTENLERAYWRRKLPLGFRFYLERLVRALLQEEPPNGKEFAAAFFEELLVQRNSELNLLPESPYFYKFLARIPGARIPAPRTKKQVPSRSVSPGSEPIRCTRCGRIIGYRQGSPVIAPSLQSNTSEQPPAYYSPKPTCGWSVDADGCRVCECPYNTDKFGHRRLTRQNVDSEMISRSITMLLDF